MLEISWLSEDNLASHEGQCSLELVEAAGYFMNNSETQHSTSQEIYSPV